MNAMHMPGFTAETSLYKTSRHYQSVTTQSYSSGEQGVISQALANGLCELWCNWPPNWQCGRNGCFPTNCYWIC
jgi:hypothetical protein